MSAAFDFAAIVPRLAQRLHSAQPRPVRGRVRRIRGIMVYASLPMARIGELCQLYDPVTGRGIPAEVVGFENDEAVLTPIGELEGLSTRCEVIPTGELLSVPVGEHLLGRVISPLGEWLDGDRGTQPLQVQRYPVHAEPPAPFSRLLIKHPLQLGIRAIDGLLTVARGQRVGIFGEPGVGKSSLLASIVKGTDADVIVLGLIGERGREVRELLDVQLDAAARARTVAVVATSDRPAMERVKAAHVATSLAEYFRDQGKHVLLLMDSVTRFARAQREIGLAAGEPPTRRGFPPSFFAALPRLLERAGPGAMGTITGLYTVLVEGDGSLDPVAEEVTSILDGHIVLSAALAQRNHFPAIDVLRSRSRLMEAVSRPLQRRCAAAIRESMAQYDEVELLLRVGEYRSGTDAGIDAAVARQPAIEAFLRQPADQYVSFGDTLKAMSGLLE
ncbi:FliI/YscN family ATPase [Pseudomonas sp. UBA4194]|uniref:FliI/YscN family ATPase n=1 Tax=Pseudomonas sp. UBA4194 TaxID=1947317 RepID=UPI0025EB01EC|nr:FliI/YscN family ATPase [Pseudomonas sp. UBA4194]